MPIFSSQRGTTGIIGRGYRIPYKFRQIITTGYVAGGYKDSVAWRNVCKLNQSTDTSSSLGDLLQVVANYTSGAHNRNVAFMWGATAVNTISAYTACFNMRNDTTYANTNAMNTPVNIGDSGTIQLDNEQAWIFNSATNPIGGAGGGYQIMKFNLNTETCSTSTTSQIANIDEGGAAHYNDRFGFIWGLGKIKFDMYTETQTTGGNYANHGQQKGVPAKDGFGYGGNEGSYNGGNNFRKWNQLTDVLQSTMAKPITDSGEENFSIGQDHHWMLGMYNTAGQNNRAWKFSHATDTGFEGGASMQPSAAGIAGRSSGHGYWRD